jgi:hypothetical protein
MGRRRLKKQGFTSGQAGLARREQMTRLRIGIKVPTQLHSKPHAADCATIHARVVAVKEMQRQRKTGGGDLNWSGIRIFLFLALKQDAKAL